MILRPHLTTLNVTPAENTCDQHRVRNASNIPSSEISPTQERPTSVRARSTGSTAAAAAATASLRCVVVAAAPSGRGEAAASRHRSGAFGSPRIDFGSSRSEVRWTGGGGRRLCPFTPFPFPLHTLLRSFRPAWAWKCWVTVAFSVPPLPLFIFTHYKLYRVEVSSSL